MNDFVTSDPDDSASLRPALEAAGMGIWEWDVERGELRCDQQSALLLGIEPGAPGGPLERLVEHIHPDDLPGLQGAIQAGLVSGERFALEYRLLRPDGSVSWIQTRGRATLDGEGRAVRMIG